MKIGSDMNVVRREIVKQNSERSYKLELKYKSDIWLLQRETKELVGGLLHIGTWRNNVHRGSP